MMTLFNVIRRDLKLFFKDRGMFFSALITPMILLVLYATFLAKVYRESFASALPDVMKDIVPDSLLDGTVTSQLISALLAVSCVTVSFCANLLMINDKSSGAIRDFTVSPVKRRTIAAGYFAASASSTLIVTFSALTACLLYLSTQGWYMSFSDVLFVILDVFLLTLFGTAISSCVNFFLTTNGQASAVGTIVSAGYGFICGAYMPIASFGEGLQKVLSFFPGTYGTCLIKNHMMRGVFAEMKNIGFPDEVVESIKDSIDVNIYFFGEKVAIPAMYAVTAGSVALLTALFILFHILKKSRSTAQ
ncbi:MAG: ABC transporter permease [Clostridia bacterium]|nr:ABC transporter permease [Clostridia bacterium]